MAAPKIPILIPRSRVSEITGLQRSAIYERIARGEFPKPVTVGSASVRWVESEVVRWVQQQIDASRTPSSVRKAASPHLTQKLGGGQ
ncbi:helix-turn-helix transcriptional regulator [Paraburkholderia dokdonensis]|uniref:helix-turn-helix transcriptional regulator n=1 Tax=Paraburkholderia dokdonensis TaxID=2211211 RepID=UPI00101A3F43|nr:AlpA family phage regulatory protein [Paraburkholderia dokdonensis]